MLQKCFSWNDLPPRQQSSHATKLRWNVELTRTTAEKGNCLLDSRPKILLLLLLGGVALVRGGAGYSHQTRERSVGRSVCPVHCGKNGGSDADAVWHHRSGGSRDDGDGGVWWSVDGKGYFGGEFGASHCNLCRVCLRCTLDWQWSTAFLLREAQTERQWRWSCRDTRL